MKASQNITKSTLLTILSQFPAHVFGILAGIFVTRILGPEGKGLYTIFYANSNLFRTVFGFSIINSIVFFVANKRITEKRLKGIVSVLILLTLLLSVTFLFIWINSEYINLFLPDYEPYALLFILFIVTIVIAQINVAFTAYFQGLRHFKIVNWVLIMNGLYSFLVFSIAYLLHVFKYYCFGLPEIIILSVLILLLNTLHWVVYYLKNCKISYDFNTDWKNDFRTFFQFTGLNHIANILLFFNHRLILWFIAFYLDNWQLGIFSLGIGLAQLLYLFSNPLSLVLESFLSAEKPDNQGEVFSIFSRIQFTVILIICIIAACISPYLLPRIYGKDFEQSVGILNIILVGIVMSCQSGIFSSLFLASDRLKYNVITSVVGILTTVISAPLLIQKYQITGAAFSQLLTYTSVFLYQYILIRTKTSVDYNLFIITRTDVKFIKEQLRLVKERGKDKDSLGDG